MTDWWVVQTEANFEHVARLLLMRHGFTTYAPRIRHRGRIAWLFPTYLFVGAREQFYPILWTNRVVRLLMSGDRPAHLDDNVIRAIHTKERNGFVQLPPRAKPFKKGQNIRLVNGKFAGHIGLYDGMSSRERSCVLLELLGRKVRVELAKDDKIEVLPVVYSPRMRY